jgi:hypothetical protein
MDAARQILRYSIPGSLLLLLVLAYQYGLEVVGWRRDIGIVLHRVGRIPAPVVLAATIPIGFVVYQLYYFLYSPISRRGWVRRDRGGEILGALPEQQLDHLRHVFGMELNVDRRYRPAGTLLSPKARDHRTDDWSLRFERWPVVGPAYARVVRGFGLLELCMELYPGLSFEAAAKRYKRQWYENWDAVRATLDALALRNGKEIKSEYTSLSDIYHALGASRAAATTAWVLFVTYNALVHWGDMADHLVGSLLLVGASAATSAFLAYVFHVARRRTWKVVASTVSHGLRSVLTWSRLDEPPTSDAGPA